MEATRAAKRRAIVEEVGSYEPKTKKRILNADRIKYWISVGAQPTGTVHNMLINAGIISGKKINVLPKKTVAKVEEPVVEAPAPVAVTEVVAEAPAPAEEVVAEAPVEAPVA